MIWIKIGQKVCVLRNSKYASISHKLRIAVNSDFFVGAFRTIFYIGIKLEKKLESRKPSHSKS